MRGYVPKCMCTCKVDSRSIHTECIKDNAPPSATDLGLCVGGACLQKVRVWKRSRIFSAAMVGYFNGLYTVCE